MNKSASLEADVYSRNFDIMAVTETHLDDSISFDFHRVTEFSHMIEIVEEGVC